MQTGATAPTSAARGGGGCPPLPPPPLLALTSVSPSPSSLSLPLSPLPSWCAGGHEARAPLAGGALAWVGSSSPTTSPPSSARAPQHLLPPGNMCFAPLWNPSYLYAAFFWFGFCWFQLPSFSSLGFLYEPHVWCLPLMRACCVVAVICAMFRFCVSGIGGHEASASLSLLAQHGKELLHNIVESQSNNLTIPTRRLTNRIMFVFVLWAIFFILDYWYCLMTMDIHWKGVEDGYTLKGLLILKMVRRNWDWNIVITWINFRL